MFKYVGNYAQKLKFVKENQNRNKLIAKLGTGLSVNGNTVLMCSHIQHMKDIFIEIIKLKDPTITIEEKHISSKTSLAFQEQMNVFYIAGATSVKDRELIMAIFNSCVFEVSLSFFLPFRENINFLLYIIVPLKDSFFSL